MLGICEEQQGDQYNCGLVTEGAGGRGGQSHTGDKWDPEPFYSGWARPLQV